MPDRRSSPPGPRLSPGKQVAFAVVSVLLLLVMLEGVVRAYHAVTALGRTEVGLRAYVRDDAELGYRLVPGAQHLAIRVNSLGFRGPEISEAKPSGVYRVVAMGDSATFGPHEEECAYPFALQRRLDARFGAGRFEIVNGALEGYRAENVLRHLQRDVVPIDPDLVLFLVGWNDLYQVDPASAAEEEHLEASFLARLFSYSDAAQTFRRLYFLRLRPLSRAPESRLRDESLVYQTFRPIAYEAMLHEMVRLTRTTGARAALLTWPTILADQLTEDALAKVHYPWHTISLENLRALYEEYQVAVRRVAREEHVPVIDAAAFFDTLDKEPLFKDTAHFYCEGHALLAEYLEQVLLTGPDPLLPSA